MGVTWGAGLLLGGTTDGRSLAVMAPLGLIVLLNGWGVLTNWGGIWDRAAQDEQRHYDAAEQLLLGQTKLGRLVRGWNRNDDQVSRGLGGAMAILIGPIFLVLGVLAGVGIFNPTS